MRARFIVPVALIGLSALLLPACGGDDGDTAAATSDDRGSANDTGSNSSSDGGSDTGSEDSTSSGGGDEGSTDTPDLGDLADQIPGMGEISDCFDLAASYATLQLEALSGQSGADGAKAKAEAMKEVLPDDLHDDIDVVAEAIGKVSEEGIINGSEALDTPEYNAANDAINEFFTQECGG